MTICNFFRKVRTRYFGDQEFDPNSTPSNENKVRGICYKKHEIIDGLDVNFSSFSDESLKFEILDFKSEDSETNVQSLNRRCYSVDAQQRRQNRLARKVNANLSLSFSGPHSHCKPSRDIIYADLVRKGAPSFGKIFSEFLVFINRVYLLGNSWSHINEKRSSRSKLSDFINSEKANRCNSSSFCINGYQYSNLTSNDFRKIGDLGSGNFGYVQRFLHLQSGSHIAVKRMKYRLDFNMENGLDDDSRKHVLNELELLSKSQHENIVKFFGYILMNYDSELWLCMELMDCCFDRLMYQSGNSPQIIPESIIGSVTVSIIDALIYLKQTHQMIHRDIKPSNILINHQGKIKLCDFGISGCLIDSMTSSRTMGSLAYQAPERIQPPTDSGIDFKYDCRVDVWSLGMTLLEMALGHHPYGQWTVAFEIITKIMNPKDVPTLSTTKEKYSKNFKNFIATCLQHDYRLRPKYDQIKMTKFYKEQVQKFNTQIARDWFNLVHFQQ